MRTRTRSYGNGVPNGWLDPGEFHAMRAAARLKWWGVLCETTTDNGLARTSRAGAR